MLAATPNIAISTMSALAALTAASMKRPDVHIVTGVVTAFLVASVLGGYVKNANKNFWEQVVNYSRSQKRMVTNLLFMSMVLLFHSAVLANPLRLLAAEWNLDTHSLLIGLATGTIGCFGKLPIQAWLNLHTPNKDKIPEAGVTVWSRDKANWIQGVADAGLSLSQSSFLFKGLDFFRNLFIYTGIAGVLQEIFLHFFGEPDLVPTVDEEERSVPRPPKKSVWQRLKDSVAAYKADPDALHGQIIVGPVLPTADKVKKKIVERLEKDAIALQEKFGNHNPQLDSLWCMRALTEGESTAIKAGQGHKHGFL